MLKMFSCNFWCLFVMKLQEEEEDEKEEHEEEEEAETSPQTGPKFNVPKALR